MPEQNSPSSSSPLSASNADSSVGPPPASSSGGAPAAPAPKPNKTKWRRRILIGVGSVVALLVLLVLLLPTLAGSSTVRGIVVDDINKLLAGHLEITDWSFSWTSGLKITGVTMTDSKNSQVLQVRQFSSDLSLWGALRGNYAMGKTSLDGVDFVVVRQKDGQLNLLALAKAAPAPSNPAPTPPAANPSTPTPATPNSQPPQTASVPINLPALSGDFVLSNCAGTLVDEISGKSIQVSAIDGELKIDGINEPIIDHLTIKSAPIGQTPSTLSIDGSITAVKDGKLDLNHIIDILAADQTIAATNFDLASVVPALAVASPGPSGTSMSGILTGTGKLAVQPGGVATLAGAFDVPHMIVGGSALNGDQFDAGHTSFNLDATASGQDPTSRVKVNTLKFNTQQIALGVTADAAQGSLANLGNFLPQILNATLNGKNITLPGSSTGGSVVVTLHADVPAIVNQLPHTTQLNPSTVLTTGTLDHSTNITIAQDKVTVDVKTDLALAGASHGTPVAFPNITSDIALTATGGTKPSISVDKANVTSSFLTVNAAGPTLSQLKATGHLDLDDLRSKLAPFFNLGNLSIGGTGTLSMNSAGDPLAANAVLKTTNSLELDHLKLSGLGSLPTITQDRLVIGLTGDITNDSAAVAQAIHNIELTLQTGPPEAPTIDIHAKADASFGQVASTTFQVDKCNIALPQFVMEHKDSLADLGKPAPAAANGPPAAPSLPARLASGADTLSSGTIALTAAGSYDASGLNLSAPIAVAIHNVTLNQTDDAKTTKLLDNKSADVALAGKFSTLDGFAADLTTLSLTTSDNSLALSIPVGQHLVAKNLSSAKPNFAGTINITGDLAGVCRLAETFSGLPSGAYPYAGTLALSNKFSTENARLRIVQSGQIKNFQTLASDGKTVQFTEPVVALNTNMAVNLTTSTILMDGDGVNITMATSKALGIKLTGTLRDWQQAREFQDIKLGVDYDLAPLWKIIYPMLTPDQQTSYKDLKIAGKYHRDIALAGSFPAGPAFNIAIRSLTASGDLTVDLFDSNGLTIGALDVPLDLKNGVARVAYTGKPTGQDMPAAATFNTGKLDLGGITLDLSDAHPRLTIPANKKLVAQATINPVFANSYMKNFINNPAFADPQTAQGLLDISMVSCNRLPLDDLMNSTGPENDGRAEMSLNITQFQIGSSVIGQIFGFLGGRADNAVSGDIKNGKVVIEKGLAEQDMTLDIAGEKYGLHFYGTVGLLKQTLQPYNIGIPSALFSKFGKTAAGIAQSLPAELDCPLKGTVSSAKIDTSALDKTLEKAAEKGLENGALDKLFGGGSKNNSGTKAPAGAPSNP